MKSSKDVTLKPEFLLKNCQIIHSNKDYTTFEKTEKFIQCLKKGLSLKISNSIF